MHESDLTVSLETQKPKNQTEATRELAFILSTRLGRSSRIECVLNKNGGKHLVFCWNHRVVGFGLSSVSRTVEICFQSFA